MSRILPGKVIVYLLLLYVMDLAVVSIFRIGEIKPVLLYMLVLYSAFQMDWKTLLPVVCIAGLLRDLISLQTFGIETSSLVLGTVLLDLLVQKLERGIWILRVFIAFLFCTAVLVLNLILSNFFNQEPGFSWHVLLTILATAFYTACLLPVFFYVSARWFGDRKAIKQYELFG